VEPLKDPKEFGRRVQAARGYAGMKKTEFAKLMETSVPTVTRWENGEKGSIGTAIVLRQQLAERIQRATKCPPGFFGLDEAATERLEVDRLDELARQTTRLTLALESMALDADEDAVWPQYLTSDQPNVKPGNEEGNG